MNLKKKFCALFLALSLSLGLATPAAAGGSSALYIHDGTQEYHVNEDMSGEGWSYDYNSSTLTLNGFHGKYINFYENQDNTLLLASGSDNSVEVDSILIGSGTTGSGVVASEANLSIQGSGSLTVVGGISAQGTLSIQSGNINTAGKRLSGSNIIWNTTYNGTAGSWYGLEANVLHINGGTISTTTQGPTGGYAIYCDTLQMTNGNVTAISTDVDSAKGKMAVSSKNFSMTGGSFTMRMPASTSASLLWNNELSLGSNIQAVGGSTEGSQQRVSITKVTELNAYQISTDTSESLKYLCFSKGNSTLAGQALSFPKNAVTITYGDSPASNLATNTSAGGGLIQYTTSKPEVASVDSQTGAISVHKAGTTIITATAAAVPNQYEKTTAQYTLTVVPKEVSLSWQNITDRKYGDGKAVTATVTGVIGNDQVHANVKGGTALTPGNYTASVTELTGTQAGNYKLPSQTSQNYTITKADAPSVSPGTLSVSNRTAATYSFDLSQLLTIPGDGLTCGNVQYTLKSVTIPENGYYTAGSASLKGAVLSLPINAVETSREGTVGTVTITIASNHFADMEATILVNAVNKAVPTGMPTLSKHTLTYGASLQSITLSGSLTYNGTSVPGVFTWNTPEETPNAGTYDALWTFTPNDKTIYATTTGTVTLTVDKATPTGAPKYTAITTTGKTLADTKLTTAGSTFNVPGTIAWEKAASTSVEAGQSYTWVFTPDDSENYTTLTGSVTLWALSGGHLIDIDNIKNGKLAVSAESANPGDTITIAVRPNDGYTLDKLTVTDQALNNISLTANRDGTYTFTMPTSNVVVSAVFTKLDAPSPMPFTDVPDNAYYYDAVKWAVEREITSGTSPTTFHPEASCTRGQMVLFLWRAAGCPAATGSNPFTDVSSKDYFYHAVLWAVEKGITNGTSLSTFGPNDTVTRNQTVTFLYRNAGSPATSGNNPFTDVPTDTYYASAVQWAVSNNITNGTKPTTFSPNASCTRGQIVTFLYRNMA